MGGRRLSGFREMEKTMKNVCVVSLLAALAGSALGAPQESVTFTAVESRNHIDSATNVLLTHAFTGAYTVRKLTITGTLQDTAGTGTYAREASIKVTPPSGSPFIIQPFGGDDTGLAAGVTVPAGSFTAPLAPVTAAGTWSYQFFEYWDDTADDAPNATWNTVTITLDDAAQAIPAPYNPSVSKSYTNITVAGSAAAPSFTDTWTVAVGSGAADTIIVRGLGTATGANPAADINATPLYRVQVRVTAPGRPAVTLSPFRSVPGGVPASSALGDTSVTIPGGTMANPAGAWLVEVFDQLGTSASFMQGMNISLGLSTPPVALPFPPLSAGNWVPVSGTFTAAGQVKWYAVVVPADVNSGSGSALDFDMEGTALAPENDANFGLYNNQGTRMGSNFNAGRGLLPAMTFGKGTRNGPGDDALPYEGGDPNVSPAGGVANARPALPAGTYYLAVTNGDTASAYGAALYNVTASSETNTGAFTVRARYLPTVTPETPTNTDLGTLGGNSSRVVDLTTNFFEWFKVTLPAGADDTTGKYLDIDTANTPAPLNDSNIALYDGAGVIKSSNDDIAPGWGADNPTGGNSALSFGAGGATRDYSGVNANMPAGDGRDGPLTAGSYYLHVAACCTGYQANNFWVLNDYVTNPDSGSIALHINTNYPAACSAADIGVQGGIAGHDNLLNNNDFIVYIANFFNQLPSADIGAQGGVPGHDGLFDNNDFIVFINTFFTDQAACTG
jgi:hypothetical protein